MARRRHLLETARELFLERGLGAVSLAEIAHQAGVALRTIYLQYGSKHGLLHALIDDEAERHRAELLELELDGMAWRERLASLALHIARRTCAPELMRLCDIVMETADPALVDALDRAGAAQAREAVARVLALAFERAPLHGLHSAEDLCDHFLACVVGVRQRASRDPAAALERARRGLDLFLRVLPAGSLNAARAAG
jgi:AcrR family transcriptional regulator